MKHFIKYLAAILVEGFIVGFSIGFVLLFVLDIEMETAQLVLIVLVAFASTGIGGWIRNLIVKGGKFYEWVMQYNEHTIIVKVGKAGELYVNDMMLERQTGTWKNPKTELKATLESGEKITAIISPVTFSEAWKTDRSLKCELLIDGKPLRMAAA